MKAGEGIQISVIGAGDAPAGTYADAVAVGEALARRGAVVVCGGLGGVMEGACRGAHNAGGASVAIIPGPESGSANRFATHVVVTDMGHARNALVVQSGAAVVALPGKTGTLSEIALALKMGKTVVGLREWGHLEGVRVAASPEEAVELALAHRGAWR